MKQTRIPGKTSADGGGKGQPGQDDERGEDKDDDGISRLLQRIIRVELSR